MSIFRITTNRIQPLTATTFEKAGLKERDDLQRLLKSQIEVVAPDTLILTEEFSDWEDSRRRIDLLGLDKNANLVVIELKRDDDGSHMELQAIRYAAMVSTMTFEKAVDAHAEYLRRNGEARDAQQSILEFLGWGEPDEDEFAQDVKLVLVSADFGKEVTTAVLWLNDHGLGIRCVRIKPYADAEGLLLDVQQVIPLPEAEEYQVKIAAKAERERASRKELSELQSLLRRFWAELLPKPRGKVTQFESTSPSKGNWVGASSGQPGLDLNFVFGRQAPRVELYIDRGEAESTKQVFDQLAAAREQIERRFGAPLGWERMDEKRACRIRAELPAGSVRDEASWPALQDRWIEYMERFEKALRSEIDRLQR